MKIWWQQDVQMYYQVFFALFSIKGIEKNAKHQNNIGIFYYIQTLLTSLGNISKLLLLLKDYQDHLHIDMARLPNITNRTLRNINEHIEERINNDISISSGGSDTATGKGDLESDSSTWRYFNTATSEIQFRDKNGNIAKAKLSDIENELNYIKSLEPIDYVFDRYRGYDEIL